MKALELAQLAAPIIAKWVDPAEPVSRVGPRIEKALDLAAAIGKAASAREAAEVERWERAFRRAQELEKEGLTGEQVAAVLKDEGFAP